MKRLLAISLIILLPLFIFGCGKANSVSTPGISDTSGTSASTTNSSSTSSDSASNSSQNASNSSGVVANSNNTVTTKEKEALLNQADQELDNLLADVDSMDDVQDEDLNLEN